MTSVNFRDRHRLATVYKAALQAAVVCERHRTPCIVIVTAVENQPGHAVIPGSDVTRTHS